MVQLSKQRDFVKFGEGKLSMGLLSYLIVKGVQRATIKTIGHAAAEVIVAKSNADSQRIHAQTQKINAEIEKINTSKNNGTLQKRVEVVRIKPPRSSEKYRDMYALDAVKELLGAGFVNITLKSEKRLSKHSKKYGKIRKITINGNDDFLGVRKVPSSSKIVITYSDFKSGISDEVYEGVTRLVPGTICCIADIAKLVKPTKVPLVSNNDATPINRYCVYCGEQITNKKAKFCAICGKEIDG